MDSTPTAVPGAPLCPEFSWTEGLLAETEGSSVLLGGSGPWVRGGPPGVLLLGCGLEELPGAGCVADGGAGVQAEGGRQVQGSGAGGEGFFELAAGAQGLDRRGVAAQGGTGPGPADRLRAQGGLGVDEQVRVGGSGPSGAAGLQPGAEQEGGQVVQGAGPAAQEQAAAAGVGVGEAQGADGAAAGGVNAGQGHDEPGGRGDGGGDGVVDVVLAQRLQHGGGGPAADLDAPGGVAEDHAGREAEPEQRPEGHQGVMAL